MNRKQEINKIINELEELKQKGGNSNFIYAIDANIEFYKVIKSIFKYVWWFFKVASKLDPKKLLEINDLLPKYDSEMHKQLIIIEKKKFPSLIKNIVDEITEFIISSNNDLILLSIGSGGMELERQIITALIKQGSNRKVVFVAVDQSPLAHKMARENLSPLVSHLDFYFGEKINQDYVQSIKNKLSKNFFIIQCGNNIFSLGQIFSENYFDCVYNSLFMHHLNQQQAEKIRFIALHIAKEYFEYDGFRQLPQIIPQSLFGWSSPVLMNGAVFSGLRYIEKNKLLKSKKFFSAQNFKSKIIFLKTGYYLLKFIKEGLTCLPLNKIHEKKY